MQNETTYDYILIMQNGEPMDGVSYSDLVSAGAGLEECCEAEYIAKRTVEIEIVD